MVFVKQEVLGGVMSLITRLRESLIVVVLIVILSPSLLSAQMHTNLTEPARVGSNPVITQLDSAKRIGRHTIAEWRSLIDSTWGPGLPTADKLKIFDDYWTAVDQRWGGFPNLTVNWDSLKDVYRPEVAAGVSRGRFDAILCRLSRAVNEWHVWAFDKDIDGSMEYTFLDDTRYPNYQSFHYVPGIPIILINPLTFRTNFGAGLTPLADSTALVYSVMPDHPLGLQPGDIILGYDGVPWMTLFTELLDVEFPILGGGSWLGSTPEASLYSGIISAGMNWGLFDTIDVKKYPTNEIVHYPTSLLDSIGAPYFVATQQVPVSGVPFPDIQNSKMVSWGVITGTNIGYIYAWDWKATQTAGLFKQAVDELLDVNNVDGLVIDFRTNFGGPPNNADGGFNRLFNFDPFSNYLIARRIAGDEHLAFSIEPFHGIIMHSFSATPEIFDHPIVVLTNNTCAGGGDYNANRMRFHPMVRVFGRPTAGAYTAFVDDAEWEHGTWKGVYNYRIDHGSVYTNYNDEGFLIHKPFPVDEGVWLTRDGVAKGEDDVVKRAVEWINTLTYAHDVARSRGYVPPGQDSVLVTAVLTNPLGHSASVSSIVTDLAGVVRDSVLLFNDGLHGDGSAGDSVWGQYVQVPSDENVFAIALRTDDATQGTFRRLPSVAAFATCGPLALDSVTFKNQTAYQYCSVMTYVRSDGLTAAVKGASITCECNDPWMKRINVGTLSLPDISPGARVYPSSPFTVNYDSSTFPGYFNLKFKLAINGYTFWTDSMKLTVTGVAPRPQLPTVYSLMQNYPNPFNPTTEIRYQISEVSNVSLKVYDVLGREVRTLVNRKQGPGTYEVQFDASGLSSGVYFYRIKAEHFVDTKKLLLLK